uniref:Kazal-like domain-containing protein n=1 Tax=Anopheles melas TaxID=34690 RepID=A0A182TMY4_9DIPT
MKLVTIVPVVVVLLCLMAAASDENEAATRRWSLLPKRPSTPKWNLSAKPCACPRTYKPLCASNGQTYNNHCAFKCAKQLNASLSVKVQARCDEPDKQFDLVRTSFGAKMCASRATAAAAANVICVLLVVCTFALACEVGYFPAELCCCTMHYSPVCGNNNRTYHNYCILRCMRIRVNRSLEMAHRWDCGTTPDEQKALDIAHKPGVSDPHADQINDTDFHWEKYANLD